ncbi:unnamed protein product, partial [Choristocarpus tenellus]
MKAIFAGQVHPGAAELAFRLVEGGLTVITTNSPDTHRSLLQAGIPHQDDPRQPRTYSTLLGDVSDRASGIALVVGGLAESSAGFESAATHALVRAAAVQHEHMAVVVDEDDFPLLSGRVSNGDIDLSAHQRRSLAAKAFRATSDADSRIAANLGKTEEAEVLVIGSGGREHAIALKLAESPSVSHVFVAPGNGGTDGSGKNISNIDIGVGDTDALVTFATEKEISLVVVGPEVPLVEGIVDTMTAAGVSCFGPTAAAARLEGSKSFSKDFMTRNGIPTARYGNFTDFEAARAYVLAADHPVVVKASGLAAGKGVLIPTSKEEAVAALEEVMLQKKFGDGGDEVVIEEFLDGEEVSVLAFCDGKTALCMPGAQDHKRALDGDRGLNTGGMGAYAPAPCLMPNLAAQCQAICQETVKAMAAEGNPFLGVLFAGFMLMETGPVVLEFNVRMGDPETQVVLPLMKNDLYEVITACIQGRLEGTDLSFATAGTTADSIAATVVMAAGGYPGKYPKGMPIYGLDEAAGLPGVTVYHAGTKKTKGEAVAGAEAGAGGGGGGCSGGGVL